MQGFRIICTASSYSDREIAATKGWWVEVAASDPLVAKLKSNPAFKMTPTEVPDVIVPAASTEGMKAAGDEEADSDATGTKDDDIAKVPNIAAALVEGMKAAGYSTVEKVCAAGIDGLTKIKGIGVPTATQILLSCSEYLGDA